MDCTMYMSLKFLYDLFCATFFGLGEEIDGEHYALETRNRSKGAAGKYNNNSFNLFKD